jgi:hypothetical protein
MSSRHATPRQRDDFVNGPAVERGSLRQAVDISNLVVDVRIRGFSSQPARRDCRSIRTSGRKSLVVSRPCKLGEDGATTDVAMRLRWSEQDPLGRMKVGECRPLRQSSSSIVNKVRAKWSNSKSPSPLLNIQSVLPEDFRLIVRKTPLLSTLALAANVSACLGQTCLTLAGRTRRRGEH